MPAAAKGRGTAGDTKIWKDRIRLAVMREDGAPDVRVIDSIVAALVKEAKAGDVAAIKEIGDRLDGKAAQPVQHDGTVTMRHEQWLAKLS